MSLGDGMTRLFMSAGEASGDRLAAELLVELERRRPTLVARGVVGPRLRARGVEEVAAAEGLAAVGPWQGLRALPTAIRTMWAADRAFATRAHDLVITVDAPAWSMRLARRARQRGLRVVHWVSPQLWAWRPGRAAAVARAVDAVLCLLPFEPPLYARTGVEAVFVGHPAVDRVRPAARPGGAGPVIALAPGSRPAEVAALWRVLRRVGALAVARWPGARVVALQAPGTSLPDLDGIEVCDDVGALRADVCVACSGTLTLELAAARIPTVVVYRTDGLTWAIARRLVRIPHIALPNVLAGRLVVPEHLQDLDVEAILADVERLLGAAGDVQRGELAAVCAGLGAGAIGRTADVVERFLPGVP